MRSAAVASTTRRCARGRSRAAWFYPRLTLVGSLALGLALSLPSSIGDAARSGGSAEATAALLENAGGLAACATLAKVDADKRKKDLERLQRELALGKMTVIQRNKFREETRFALGELRDVARVAVVYGDAGESGARFDGGDAVSTAVGTESDFSRARGRARERGRRRRPSRTSDRDGGSF